MAWDTAKANDGAVQTTTASMRPKPIGLGYRVGVVGVAVVVPASMRPKPIGLGYAGDVRHCPGAALSFNEAQANWLGIQGQSEIWLSCNPRFNEAQANWLGIRDEQLGSLEVIKGASMRPKPIGLGYAMPRLNQGPHTHASMRPKPIGLGYPDSQSWVVWQEILASMRPKPIGLGYVPVRFRMQIRVQSFNEAQANWLGIHD